MYSKNNFLNFNIIIQAFERMFSFLEMGFYALSNIIDASECHTNLNMFYPCLCQSAKTKYTLSIISTTQKAQRLMRNRKIL